MVDLITQYSGLVGVDGRPLKTINIDLGHIKEQPDLIPCPFCGGIAELCFDDRLSMYYVVCTRCKVETEVYEQKDKPVMDWNRRV